MRERGAVREQSPNGIRATAHRIDAATPAERDRAVDALRAIAILGVVLGHWLVTALVTNGDGTLSVTSPIQRVPMLAPASWVFQTLALFFFVGGLLAARPSRTSADRRGMGRQVTGPL